MTELARRADTIPADPGAPGLDVDYWSNWLVFSARVANQVADTEFVSAALRGRVEAVAATILYGAEVGITPMQALQGIHVVDGRPAPSSELMRALIFRAGHTLTVHEATGTRCRVSGLRRGRPESERATVEWTLDMARAAGLLSRRNWQNYPRAMLIARATGDLARMLFPDVIKGLGYVAEDDTEWGGPEPENGTPEPARKPLQRRRKTATVKPVEDVQLPTDDPQNVPTASVTAPAVADEPARAEPVPPPAPAPVETDLQAYRDRIPDEPAPSATAPPGRYDDEDQPLPEELEPEPSAPEPTPVPRPVAPGPLKAIHAGLTAHLGTASTRDERLALLAAIVRHDVPSSKELTREDGYKVLDYFDRFDTGDASFEFEDDGTITVHVHGPVPPDDQ